jgi:hypothetical protein
VSYPPVCLSPWCRCSQNYATSNSSLLPNTPHLVDMLRDVYFPRLATFTHSINAENLALFPSFLNRHPSINHVALVPEDSLIPVPLDPILLPNLIAYNGPTFILPAIEVDCAPLNWVFLVCMISNRRCATCAGWYRLPTSWVSPKSIISRPGTSLGV